MILKSIISVIKRKRMNGVEYAKSIGVKIGKGCFISSNNYSSEPYLIEIGDYVRIANNVHFYTHGGVWAQARKLPKGILEHFGRIKIGNYSYIGDGCMITPGVIIGNDVIVAAGTVVTKSVPDGLMVGGNPMRVIGKTEDFVKRTIENNKACRGVYKLKGEERRKYIESIPEECLDRKPYIEYEDRK